MMCKHPYIKRRDANLQAAYYNCDDDSFNDGIPHPCGQCLPCRINKRRAWTGRVLLEFSQQKHAWFVTLTYADAYLPLYYNNETDELSNSICTRDVQTFFKRLRKEYRDCNIRYFGCGEYGSQTHRPHYHFIIFGLPDPSNIDKIWGKGLVHIGDVTHDSIQYVAGYTLKKLTKGQLYGRLSEKIYSSRKPGIGKAWLESFCSEIQKPKYSGHFIHELRSGNNPFSTINIGGKRYPFPKLFRTYLFEQLDSCNDRWSGAIRRYKQLHQRDLLQSYRDGKRILRNSDSTREVEQLLGELFDDLWQAGPIAVSQGLNSHTKIKRLVRKSRLFETRRDKI